MSSTTYTVTGMTCGHCVATITEAVKAVEPDPALAPVYADACGRWTQMLERDLR